MKKDKALVLFSGGQDSATCLAWALDKFDEVHTIGFDYGQAHAVELKVRMEFLKKAISWNRPSKLARDYVVPIDVINKLSPSSLTRRITIGTNEKTGLPTTFTPGRNLFFLTAAAMIAYQYDIRHIVTGVCETDYSGYPDCRDDFVKAMQLALNAGMDSDFVIHTPLMWLTKADTWDLALDIGGMALVELIVSGTHTCYRGDHEHSHPWGFGCGTCPACNIRASGFFEWGKRTRRYVEPKQTEAE